MEGGKRKERMVHLDWQGDLERLDELYWQCEAGRHERQKPGPPAKSWRALIEAWRTDPRIQKKLAPRTKDSYRDTMDRILEKNADKAVQAMTRQMVRAIHDKYADTPRRADHYIQIIRLLWNYANDKLDWDIGTNPAAGIDLYGRQRSFEPWPEWMCEKIDTAPRDVQTTYHLIRGTGQRPNAAIGMLWGDFDGEWVSVLDEKSDEKFPIFCPADLRAYLDTLPKKGRHVLAKNLTVPLGYDAVEKQFRDWRSDLGESAKPYSLHGLRKLAIVDLAEAGCTDAEIQSVTRQSLEMIAYYRKQANAKRMSKAAQLRRAKNKNGTETK